MKKASFNRKESRIILEFGGSDFKKVLKKVKALPGRKYLNCQWSVPVNLEVLNVLKCWGFEMSDSLREAYDLAFPDLANVSENIQGFKIKIYPFQTKAVEFVENKNGRALVADEMGCISGDQEIIINRAGKGFRIKLRDAYKRFNNLDKYKWDKTIKTYTRSISLDNKEFRLNEVKNILFKGIKKIYLVKTQTHEIKSTFDHVYITSKGEKELSQLSVGDKLYIIGRFFLPKLEKIVSIEYVGYEDVYDIKMKSPNNSFIVNGVVVHNCGKTIESLAWTALHPERKPVLVICGGNAKINWQREIEKTITDKIEILYGYEEIPIKEVDYYIVNYKIVKKRLNQLKKLNCKICIIDEIHNLSNYKAQRTQAVVDLTRNIKYIIGLTGTPITNRPKDFFTFLNILNPEFWPSYWNYYMSFCDPKYNGYGWDFNGASNIDILNDLIINSIMIRRLKKDVLKELPSVTKTLVFLENIDKKEYKGILKEYILSTSIKKKKAKIIQIKQEIIKLKMKVVIEWINDFLISGEKLVVFGIHHWTIDTLMNNFKDIAVKLDGRDDAKRKQIAIDKFQSDNNIKLFIANIKAGGEAITLTAASNIAIIELPWKPGDIDQPIGRCHRIGQKKAVNAWFLLGANTIEEDLAELIDEKRKVIDQAIDGKYTKDSDLLTELIKKLEKKLVDN